MTALYEEAKLLIPMGSLYSKRGELHAPQWPQYYTSAKGASIVGMDGHTYLDFSGASVGACILGYATESVDQRVTEAIAQGSTSALCCREEVELARLLTTLHPWAQQCRFTRSGGEAIAVAVRIAQAATGRTKIGWRAGSYHGWHINDPRNGTSYISNDIKQWNIAALIVEPRRIQEPDLGELDRLREHCTNKGIILIFDEISCGFRSSLGGVHLQYGITPDIVVFSKAMSNGYPMAAVVGTADVMSACDKTFISSTTWSERIGPTAALATIEILQNEPVFEHIEYIGEMVQNTLRWESRQSGVPIEVVGPPQMAHFRFPDTATQTAYTSLMLQKGFLAGKDFYPMYTHTIEHVEAFRDAVQHTLQEIAASPSIEGIGYAEAGISR